MKFSVRLNNDLPVSEYVALAQLAETAGFEQFWVSNDLFLRSAPIILAAVASATTRIEIGTCILNPYTIHPAEIAMMSATLDEWSGGRFNLGLSSGADDFLAWVSIQAEKPRTLVRESIQRVNALLSGKMANEEFSLLRWTEEAYLRFRPARRVPIYIGAMSPRMLAEIGAVADGGLPLLFPPEHYRNVLPHIQNGAAEAGRNIETLDIAACIWCSIGEDKLAAENALREKVAYYGHAMSATILQQLGLTHADFEPIEHAIMVERDVEKAKRLVRPEMLRIGIAGTSHDLIERLEALVALGVRHISFGPPLGANVGEALRVIGRDVIPHFRRVT